MNIRCTIGSLAILLLFLSSAMPVSAQMLVNPHSVPAGDSARHQLSLDQAAARVRKQTGGQILSAREYKSNGDRYYRFKINEKGRVRVIHMRPDGSRFKPGR